MRPTPAAAVAVAALALLAGPAPARPARHPNVVLIVADDEDWHWR